MTEHATGTRVHPGRPFDLLAACRNDPRWPRLGSPDSYAARRALRIAEEKLRDQVAQLPGYTTPSGEVAQEWIRLDDVLNLLSEEDG